MSLPACRFAAWRFGALLTTAALAIGAVLVIFTGCGGSPPQPVPGDEVPGYLALRENVGDFDFTPLRGRSILIDPGHGGYFRGALGPDGLTEAEVNLGVALYLRGLLEWAAAAAYLTRTADYDFLSPADSSLSGDLATRVAMIDSLHPDIFVSIHHNSTASRDPDINETQTYYPVGRDGPDLDLARAVHKHLVRNLEIEPAKIMAGNFHVLRNASVPAILGEPAMISNPVMEGRLSLARSHELEATAYFLGLLEYFAGGTPSFHATHGDTVLLSGGDLLSWNFEPGDPDAPGLDPGSVRLAVDGRPRQVSLDPDGRTVTWQPLASDLTERQSLTLDARNLAGRSTPVAKAALVGQTGGDWHLSLVQVLAAGGSSTAGDQVVSELLWWEAPDDLHNLTGWRLLPAGSSAAAPTDATSQTIDLTTFPGRRGWLLRSDPPVHSANGAGFTLLGPPSPAGAAAEPVNGRTIDPEVATIRAPWRFYELATDRTVWPQNVVPGGAWRSRRLPLPDADIAGYTNDPTAPIAAVKEGEGFWIEADGARPIIADATHAAPWPSPREPAAARTDGGRTAFAWQPLLPEMVGKVIVIDPQGGGTTASTVGPLGTRGSDLNLQVAEKAARLLRGAGCRVLLTRDDETWVPKEHVILLANRAGGRDHGADLFLTVRRSVDPAAAITTHHHHGSRVGAAWATHFADAARPLLAPGDSVQVSASSVYRLRHTACPALEVALPMPMTLDAEERLTDPAWQHAEARALLLSVAAVLCGPHTLAEAIDLATVMADGGDEMIAADRVTWAVLDGNFFWLPYEGDRPGGTPASSNILSYVNTPGIPALGDHHTLEIHAGASWQLWALTRREAGGFTLVRLLENR